jgi:RimJ/RimL family protein N-acetyltransferase
MESDPLNNKFGVIPTSEVNEEYLMRYLVRAADRQIIELFIIAKYENQYLPQNRPLMINGGVLVGSIQIQPRGDKTSEIGGYIHHPFTGKGYAKEAFTEVIDLAFSPINPIEAKEVVMETKRENEPFRSLMRKLGLESVQYEQEGN